MVFDHRLVGYHSVDMAAGDVVFADLSLDALVTYVTTTLHGSPYASTGCALKYTGIDKMPVFVAV